MTDAPWMPLYVGDYLRDTTDLMATEHGAYFLLILHCWEHGSIQNDPRIMATIAKVSRHRWPTVWARISRFFVLGGGGVYVQKRVSRERARAAGISQKRREAAMQKHSKSTAIAEQLDTHARATSQSHSQSNLFVGSQNDKNDAPKTQVWLLVDDRVRWAKAAAAYLVDHPKVRTMPTVVGVGGVGWFFASRYVEPLAASTAPATAQAPAKPAPAPPAPEPDVENLFPETTDQT